MTPSDELLLAVMMSIFAPLEAVLPRYKDLEKQQLQHEIDAMGLSVLSVEDADAVVSVVRSTVPKAFGVLEAAVERCMQLTGGSALSDMQAVVDATATHYLDVLERLVLQLSRRCVVSNAPSWCNVSTGCRSNCHDAVCLRSVKLLTSLSPRTAS